ncbi:hypothetical protein HPB50_002905 [Hyalomma asiaticum]|uniref:Uncharacterized protein n=1 Tax=Hyalomma asiaticum TaxID=266040 RepID=A0ACB7TBR3_HYAAI|nr:hypothetical protein HPB50_002905 [Hyalomma asiaticum]
MSSTESRIGDLTKRAFNLSSPASATHAPAVVRGNAGPPSPHYAMTHCQGFFPSPPTFDGTTSWSVFLRQFESAAALCAWPETHKARILVTQLRSPAAEFLEHLPASDCTATTTASSRHSNPAMVTPIFGPYILQNCSTCDRASTACKSLLHMSSVCHGKPSLFVQTLPPTLPKPS